MGVADHVLVLSVPRAAGSKCDRHFRPIKRARPRRQLTVGPDGDEGGGGEEEDVDHVAAEEEPAQRGQVVEPGGRVRVERLVEERLEVGLPAERPDGPQALEGDDEVGEDGTPSCGGGRKEGREEEREGGQRCLRRNLFAPRPRL